jgi:hypothetical protein
MSGLGGNLTYPASKQFVNSFGIINPAGGAAGTNDIRLITDLQAQEGVLGAKTLFFEKDGNYIPGGAQASYTRVDHADSVSKVANIVLEDRGPMDESNHELGFTVEAIAEHPGVYNDNLFGQRRTYAHVFDYLDPVVSGKISDADVMRAYSDINTQIYDDKGRYTGNQQGNVEACVDAMTDLEFSTDITGATFDIPGAGLYGKTLTQAAAYIDSPLAITAEATVGNTVVGDNTLTIANADAVSMYVGQTVTPAVVAPVTPAVITHIEVGATNTVITLDTVWTTIAAATFGVAAEIKKVVNNAAGLTSPGYGFIVHPAGAETLAEHSMTLTTRDIFKNLTTFNVEKLSGIFTVVADGNFELMPWAEVFREFTSMGHDAPLANMHDFEKPANTYNWVKFILWTNHSNAAIHGASHGGSYRENVILYVPDNGASSGSAGCVANLETLIALWAT